MMVAAVGLWLVWVTHVASLTNLLVLVLVSGIGNGLTVAAWQAFVPQLVPREHMLNAIRLNSTQYTVARVFGPALAGLVLAGFGAGLTFLVNAVSFVCVLVALVRIRPRPAVVVVEHGGILHHFREALAYVRRRAGLWQPLLSIGAYALLGSATMQLAEAINRRLFHTGPGAYGLLVGAFGVGGLFGSAFVLSRADQFRKSYQALTGLTLFAGAEALMGAAPVYWVGALAATLMGAAHTLTVVSLTSSVHTIVDEEHRGRVSSMGVLAVGGGVPIGALLQGIAAGYVGLRATVITSAALLGLYVAYVVVRMHALRSADAGTS